MVLFFSKLCARIFFEDRIKEYVVSSYSPACKNQEENDPLQVFFEFCKEACSVYLIMQQQQFL